MAQQGKNLPAMQETGDVVLIPGLERSPGGGKWQPTPVFLPERSHGQRSLVGYSPWGHKELDMTEQLSKQATALQVLLPIKKISFQIMLSKM